MRARLIDAATELAVEVGFDACGLRDIARRAGVSPGMISYYFGDRQGLHAAMFARAFERMHDNVAALMARPVGEGESRIDELVRIQVSTIAADPWLPLFVMREMLSRSESPMRSAVAQMLAEGPVDGIIQLIRESQARGEIDPGYDPRMLAMTLMSLGGFPFVVLPIVGDRLGIALDDAFPERLIAHNQKLLSSALRARPENAR